MKLSCGGVVGTLLRNEYYIKYEIALMRNQSAREIYSASLNKEAENRAKCISAFAGHKHGLNLFT